MVTLSKSLLNKIVGWSKSLPGKNDHSQLAENLQVYLRGEFRLSPEAMVTLQCVAQRGSFAGRPVKLIRIFDKAAAHERGIVVKTYRDLDTHRELIRFEGQIFKKDGIPYLKKINPLH